MRQSSVQDCDMDSPLATVGGIAPHADNGGTPPLSVPLAVTARSNTLIGQSGISSLIDQSWAPQQTETLRNSSVAKSRRDLQREKGGITPRRLLTREARERAAQHSTAHHRTRSKGGPSGPRRRRAYSFSAWVGFPAPAQPVAPLSGSGWGVRVAQQQRDAAPQVHVSCAVSMNNRGS